jgi:hypothetical protein
MEVSGGVEVGDCGMDEADERCSSGWDSPFPPISILVVRGVEALESMEIKNCAIPPPSRPDGHALTRDRTHDRRDYDKVEEKTRARRRYASQDVLFAAWQLQKPDPKFKEDGKNVFQNNKQLRTQVIN